MQWMDLRAWFFHDFGMQDTYIQRHEDMRSRMALKKKIKRDFII